MKQLLRHPLTQAILGQIMALYLRFVALTSCWQARGAPPAERPLIIALWHQKLLLLPWLMPNERASGQILISGSRDGQLIAKTALALGLSVVSGSSSKGGSSAVRHVLRGFKSLKTLYITPDGPRGPARQAQAGTIELARLSKAQIIPVGIASQRFWQFKSWDNFQIPKPFNTFTIYWGEPLANPSKSNLTKALNDLTSQAEQEVRP